MDQAVSASTVKMLLPMTFFDDDDELHDLEVDDLRHEV